MRVYDLTKQYQGGYTARRPSTSHLVVHHAAALYPAPTGSQDVAAIADWHINGRGWPGIGYHEVLAEESPGGPIAAYIVSDPDLQRAHVMGHNDDSWGVCCATNFGAGLPEQKWIDALARRLVVARGRYPNAVIIGHKERVVRGYATSCPGPRWLEWKGRLLARVADVLGEGKQTIAPSSGVYTEESPILGLGRLTPDRVAGYVVRRGSLYNAYDLRSIFSSLAHWCDLGGVNFDLAAAQVLKETTAEQPNGAWWPLSSWWAQRPRRASAGIGVTGVTSRARPAALSRVAEGVVLPLWAKDGMIWREGISFPSWDLATRAQVGRLLLYAIKRDAPSTREQDALMRYAEAVRPFPIDARGSAPALRALGYVHNPARAGWAKPGLDYGEGIADIANRLVKEA